MHEFDKVTMMKGLADLLSLYKEVKPHMVDVIDDHKLMSAAHAGEIEKLVTDWSIING